VRYKDNDHAVFHHAAASARDTIKPVCKELSIMQDTHRRYFESRLPRDWAETMQGPPTQIADGLYKVVLDLTRMNEILMQRILQLEDIVEGKAPLRPPYPTDSHFRDYSRIIGQYYTEYAEAAEELPAGSAVGLDSNGRVKRSSSTVITDKQLESIKALADNKDAIFDAINYMTTRLPNVVDEARRKLSE